MLRRGLFTIQRPTRVADGQGGWRKVFVTLTTERGRVSLNSLTIREATRPDQIIGGQVRSNIRRSGYFRFNADIVKGDRVIDTDDVTFDVISVRSHVRRLELELSEYQVDA